MPTKPKFVHLGEKLEALREKHEQGLITSIEFLKLLLELAKEGHRQKEVVPEQETTKASLLLPSLFNGIKNKSTPVIVERIVQISTASLKSSALMVGRVLTAGKQEVKKKLCVVWSESSIRSRQRGLR